MFRRTPPERPPNGHSGNGAKNGHAPGKGKNGHLPTNGKIETVVGASAALNGALTANGGVRIDGGFDGTIEVNGPLVIGEGAKVVAEIKAQAVSVAGTVKGNIAADKVEILSSGRIFGDLTVAAFSTEEGAYLRGQVLMSEAAAPEPEALPTA